MLTCSVSLSNLSGCFKKLSLATMMRRVMKAKFVEVEGL